MDKGQISRALKPMISKGLVVSETHQTDNRQTLLSLSTEGQAIHDSTVTVMRERQVNLTQNVAEQDLQTFFDVLEKIYQNAEVPET